MNVSHDGGGTEDIARLRMLMALLADANEKMMVIASEFRRRPRVTKATSGCDMRKYRDTFRFDAECHCFGTYVEVEIEIENGSWVTWLMDVNCTPAGWEISSSVDSDDDLNGDDAVDFPTLSSRDFTEFVRQVGEAMENFVEAARSYQLP
jgi:hypothetical protein